MQDITNIMTDSKRCQGKVVYVFFFLLIKPLTYSTHYYATNSFYNNPLVCY